MSVLQMAQGPGKDRLTMKGAASALGSFAGLVCRRRREVGPWEEVLHLPQSHMAGFRCPRAQHGREPERFLPEKRMCPCWGLCPPGPIPWSGAPAPADGPGPGKEPTLQLPPSPGPALPFPRPWGSSVLKGTAHPPLFTTPPPKQTSSMLTPILHALPRPGMGGGGGPVQGWPVGERFLEAEAARTLHPQR